MVDDLLVVGFDLSFDVSLMGRDGFHLDLHLIGDLDGALAGHPHAQHV